jgi:hypothetical protein
MQSATQCSTVSALTTNINPNSSLLDQMLIECLKQTHNILLQQKKNQNQKEKISPRGAPLILAM